MTKQVELTLIEQGIIESALNAYWNDAHDLLSKNSRDYPLGDIEKDLLEQRKAIVLPLLRRFENL